MAVTFDNLNNEQVEMLLLGITVDNARQTLVEFNGTRHMKRVLVRVLAIAKVDKDRKLFDLAVSGINELAGKTGNTGLSAEQAEALWNK